jgi:hypothetical protein
LENLIPLVTRGGVDCATSPESFEIVSWVVNVRAAFLRAAIVSRTMIRSPIEKPSAFFTMIPKGHIVPNKKPTRFMLAILDDFSGFCCTIAYLPSHRDRILFVCKAEFVMVTGHICRFA